jgi:hypothetical protein
MISVQRDSCVTTRNAAKRQGGCFDTVGVGGSKPLAPTEKAAGIAADCETTAASSRHPYHFPYHLEPYRTNVGSPLLRPARGYGAVPGPVDSTIESAQNTCRAIDRARDRE